MTLASQLQAARLYVHRPGKSVSRAIIDINQASHIGQLPGVNLGHLKDGDPSANYQEGKDDRNDDSR